uniref:Phosphoribosyl-AMP cyclohydrolase n=1 Tax=Anthurium amnicola TaxID=1678845 RepID=A0A1D1YND0_9ARAE
MEVALSAPRNLPFSLRFRTTASGGLGHHLGQHRCFLFSYLHHQKHTVKCSLKAPTAEHFGEPNKFATYWHMLSETLWRSLPEPVIEFPWKKAEVLILQRLLHLGKKAMKWFLVFFLLVNFPSDVFFSFSRNRELMIPLGLFIGIVVADFFNETSKELLHCSTKDLTAGKLLAIGTIFASFRLVTPHVALPGRMVLSHISNGGLMQALWLLKELQDTEGEKDVESPSLSKQVE